MRPALTRSALGLALVTGAQLVCSGFLIFDMLTSLLLIPTGPMDWQLRELMDVGAALGLMAGGLLGLNLLWRVLREGHRAERARADAETRLRRSSTAFRALLEERFAEWELTPAERDVALFALKGFSLAEMAALRSTTEGTIKTQTNAIYRKAGVTVRPQLLSLFSEDLTGDDGTAPPDPAVPELRKTG